MPLNDRLQYFIGSWIGRCVIVAITAASLGAGPVSGAETITVPGGTQAIANLLGHVDQRPEEFFSSLNRSLLSTADPKHEWKESPKRRSLVQYLEDIERLRKVFPDRLVVGTAPKPAKKAFIQLAGECGFNAKLKKGRFDLAPVEGDNKERRRRLCAALGMDLHRLASTFGGETVEIEFHSDEIDLPFSFAQWSAIAGKAPMREEPLRALAQDQRFGLVMEGQRRLANGVLDGMGSEFLRWAHTRAPATLYRYASVLEMKNGKLSLPGGEQATTAWQDIVGESPQNASIFVRELLTKKEGRAAYLWQAMHFAGEDAVNYYLGTGSSSLGDDRKYVKRLFGKLDNTATGSFDSRHGGDLGFSVFVRSVPVAPYGGSLDLPGGTGIWFQAIKGNRPPRDREDLAREVAKGKERELDDGEFLLKALTEETDMERWKLPVLPRLIRAANIFSRDQQELLSPENVILLARASDHFPAALDVLDALDFRDAKVVEDYLLAVGRLSAISDLAERELLSANFQGGVEWLRALAYAGKIPPNDLEDRLARWSRIQRIPAQFGWIASLLRSLPTVPDTAPGRGPFERAMIDSLVATENQVFQWKDLEYGGQRATDLAQAMAGILEAQAIPSADLLVAIFENIDQLEDAAREEDLAESLLLAKELRTSIEALPVPDFGAGLKDKQLLQRVTNVDRTKVQSILSDLLKTKKAKKLARQVEEIEALRGLLAADLRAFLLAPAYLVAMGDQSNPLLVDSGLIRKHLLVEFVEGGKDRDLAWTTAKVSRDKADELGTFVRGSPSSVPSALADFNLSAMTSGDAGSRSNLNRARLWYKDLVGARWQDFTVDRTGLVAALRALGESVFAKLAEDGSNAGTPLGDLARRLVPSARLERALATGSSTGLLSPSDVFGIGLGAVEADLLEPEARSAFDEAALRAGADWRRELDRIGPATPHLNGKTRPWVGAWPSYEAVERESKPAALNERELLDLRIALLDYMGRHELPGGVGADLARKTLELAVSDLKTENTHDWESWVRWVAQLDDDFFDSRMRECLKDGLYRLQSF